MRISLLLGREPFGAILEQTLTNHWALYYGQQFDIHWHFGKKRVSNTETQEWLVNIYLNAIFEETISSTAFDPIRREFERSTVRWKRPLQRNYVALATNQSLAKHFAQARLHVSPAVPDVSNILIVPGNHKLRLLNHEQQTVKNVLKAGFLDHFMHSELEARQIAEKCHVPMPEIRDIHIAEGWYCENYVSGTPINRLADRSKADTTVNQVVKSLHQFIRTTQQQEPISDYLANLAEALQVNIDEHHLLTTERKKELHTISKSLRDAVETTLAIGESEMITAVTHGDFQPANILVNQDGPWLIDWEYAARRQSGYDALVYSLEARFPSGLAKRLDLFVDKGMAASTSIDLNQWPGLKLDNRHVRQRHAALFLIEELLLHLIENGQPPLTQLGNGLKQIVQEGKLWLLRS